MNAYCDSLIKILGPNSDAYKNCLNGIMPPLPTASAMTCTAKKVLEQTVAVAVPSEPSDWSHHTVATLVGITVVAVVAGCLIYKAKKNSDDRQQGLERAIERARNERNDSEANERRAQEERNQALNAAAEAKRQAADAEKRLKMEQKLLRLHRQLN
jgi:hypothetical protein